MSEEVDISYSRHGTVMSMLKNNLMSIPLTFVKSSSFFSYSYWLVVKLSNKSQSHTSDFSIDHHKIFVHEQERWQLGKSI